MNIVRAILKEAGGRIENAAGSINSNSNMFAGSSGNAISDKIGQQLGMGSGDNNPIKTGEESENTESIDTTSETPEIETSETDTSEMETFSDEKLKGYEEYQRDNKIKSNLKGNLKNLDLDPLSSKPVTSGGGNAAMANMFSNLMNNSGSEGADMGGDMGDMGDMADAADAASDERLKRIFGENEDAIKSFAKINAIKFVYNDKAKEIPGSENKGVDDDMHYGVKAQEIAENPLTESAVHKDPLSDYLTIDVRELTTANTAIISEICKRILMIEKVLGIKVE